MQAVRVKLSTIKKKKEAHAILEAQQLDHEIKEKQTEEVERLKEKSANNPFDSQIAGSNKLNDTHKIRKEKENEKTKTTTGKMSAAYIKAKLESTSMLKGFDYECMCNVLNGDTNIDVQNALNNLFENEIDAIESICNEQVDVVTSFYSFYEGKKFVAKILSIEDLQELPGMKEWALKLKHALDNYTTEVGESSDLGKTGDLEENSYDIGRMSTKTVLSKTGKKVQRKDREYVNIGNPIGNETIIFIKYKNIIRLHFKVSDFSDGKYAESDNRDENEENKNKEARNKTQSEKEKNKERVLKGKANQDIRHDKDNQSKRFEFYKSYPTEAENLSNIELWRRIQNEADKYVGEVRSGKVIVNGVNLLTIIKELTGKNVGNSSKDVKKQGRQINPIITSKDFEEEGKLKPKAKVVLNKMHRFEEEIEFIDAPWRLYFPKPTTYLSNFNIDSIPVQMNVTDDYKFYDEDYVPEITEIKTILEDEEFQNKINSDEEVDPMFKKAKYVVNMKKAILNRLNEVPLYGIAGTLEWLVLNFITSFDLFAENIYYYYLKYLLFEYIFHYREQMYFETLARAGTVSIKAVNHLLSAKIIQTITRGFDTMYNFKNEDGNEEYDCKLACLLTTFIAMNPLQHSAFSKAITGLFVQCQFCEGTKFKRSYYSEMDYADPESGLVYLGEDEISNKPALVAYEGFEENLKKTVDKAEPYLNNDEKYVYRKFLKEGITFIKHDGTNSNYTRAGMMTALNSVASYLGSDQFSTYLDTQEDVIETGDKEENMKTKKLLVRNVRDMVQYSYEKFGIQDITPVEAVLELAKNTSSASMERQAIQIDKNSLDYDGTKLVKRQASVLLTTAKKDVQILETSKLLKKNVSEIKDVLAHMGVRNTMGGRASRAVYPENTSKHVAQMISSKPTSRLANMATKEPGGFEFKSGMGMPIDSPHEICKEVLHATSNLLALILALDWSTFDASQKNIYEMVTTAWKDGIVKGSKQIPTDAKTIYEMNIADLAMFAYDTNNRTRHILKNNLGDIVLDNKGNRSGALETSQKNNSVNDGLMYIVNKELRKRIAEYNSDKRLTNDQLRDLRNRAYRYFGDDVWEIISYDYEEQDHKSLIKANMVADIIEEKLAPLGFKSNRFKGYMGKFKGEYLKITCAYGKVLTNLSLSSQYAEKKPTVFNSLPDKLQLSFDVDNLGVQRGWNYSRKIMKQMIGNVLTLRDKFGSLTLGLHASAYKAIGLQLFLPLTKVPMLSKYSMVKGGFNFDKAVYDTLNKEHSSPDEAYKSIGQSIRSTSEFRESSEIVANEYPEAKPIIGKLSKYSRENILRLQLTKPIQRELEKMSKKLTIVKLIYFMVMNKFKIPEVAKNYFRGTIDEVRGSDVKDYGSSPYPTTAKQIQRLINTYGLQDKKTRQYSPKIAVMRIRSKWNKLLPASLSAESLYSIFRREGAAAVSTVLKAYNITALEIFEFIRELFRLDIRSKDDKYRLDSNFSHVGVLVGINDDLIGQVMKYKSMTSVLKIDQILARNYVRELMFVFGMLGKRLLEVKLTSLTLSLIHI